MLRLSKESAAAVEEFAEKYPAYEGHLRDAIGRVLSNPSGRHEPTHRYVRKYHAASKIAKVPADVTVWEFRTSRLRALFVMKGGVLTLVPVRGMRMMRVEDAPWH